LSPAAPTIELSGTLATDQLGRLLAV